MKPLAVVAATLGLLVACRNAAGPEIGPVRLGVWGASDAGAMVTDTAVTHVHIGCSAGNIIGLLATDSSGHFVATGTYNITLYPVQTGPDRPARFEGSVVGGVMELTVTLTDTAVTLGPVRLTFGREPGMTVCPICWMPGDAIR